METVLVIDDDETFNGVLTRALRRRGMEAEGATDGAAALAAAQRQPPDRVVLDLNLAGHSGLSLIDPLLAINPDCRIVVLTGYASIATAVDAIKLGAVQYLAKPVEVDAIVDFSYAFTGRRRAAVGRPAGMGAHPARAARARRQHLRHRPRAEDAPAHAAAEAGQAASEGLARKSQPWRAARRDANRRRRRLSIRTQGKRRPLRRQGK